MEKQKFIQILREIIKDEQTRYNSIPENNFVDRAMSLGKVNGLLRAWEIAQNMEK